MKKIINGDLVIRDLPTLKMFKNCIIKGNVDIRVFESLPADALKNSTIEGRLCVTYLPGGNLVKDLFRYTKFISLQLLGIVNIEDGFLSRKRKVNTLIVNFSGDGHVGKDVFKNIDCDNFGLGGRFSLVGDFMNHKKFSTVEIGSILSSDSGKIFNGCSATLLTYSGSDIPTGFGSYSTFEKITFYNLSTLTTKILNHSKVEELLFWDAKKIPSDFLKSLHSIDEIKFRGKTGKEALLWLKGKTINELTIDWLLTADGNCLKGSHIKCLSLCHVGSASAISKDFLSHTFLEQSYYINSVIKKRLDRFQDGFVFGDMVSIDLNLWKFVSRVVLGNVSAFKLVVNTTYDNTRRFVVVDKALGLSAHGRSVRDAMVSLNFKVDKKKADEKFDQMTVDSVVSFSEAIELYQYITRACNGGISSFLGKGMFKIQETYTMKEIAQYTKGEYGNVLFCSRFGITL